MALCNVSRTESDVSVVSLPGRRPLPPWNRSPVRLPGRLPGMIVALSLMAACSSPTAATSGAPATPAPQPGRPVDLTQVDPCGLLEPSTLDELSLGQGRPQGTGDNNPNCKYSSPTTGVDTLIIFRPGSSWSDFEGGLHTADRTTTEQSVTASGVPAVQFRTSTTRGGHTACGIAVELGQRQLVVFVDDDLGGRDASIDSMCSHVGAVSDRAVPKLTG
jgi:Protein of unknown function (DUF3558)